MCTMSYMCHRFLSVGIVVDCVAKWLAEESSVDCTKMATDMLGAAFSQWSLIKVMVFLAVRWMKHNVLSQKVDEALQPYY